MDFHLAYGSPAARKVRIYLLEKDATVTEHPKQRGFLPIEEIAPLNPNLTIPVMVDGEIRLYDSQVMVAYVLEKYPEVIDADPPLMPTIVRGDQKWQDANVLSTLQTLAVSIEHVTCMKMVDNLTEDTVSYLGRENTRIESILDWLESQATPDGFAPGWFSLMDIMFIVLVEFWETKNRKNWRGRPNLDALHAKFSNRPSVEQTQYKLFGQ